MFATDNSFHLVHMVQLVNLSKTFLSRTTLSSWCHNMLDLFLTSYPSLYNVKLFPFLGLSDHLRISVSCSVSSSLRQERPPPSVRRRFCHFGAANWSDLQLYFSDFP